MSIIKYVTLQKIVAHDFRYGPRILLKAMTHAMVWIAISHLTELYIAVQLRVWADFLVYKRQNIKENFCMF